MQIGPSNLQIDLLLYPLAFKNTDWAFQEVPINKLTLLERRLGRRKKPPYYPPCIEPFLDRYINDVEFAVFDTETTGFESDARIHQIGVTTLVNGQATQDEEGKNFKINIFDEVQYETQSLVQDYDYEELYDCHYLPDIIEEFEDYMVGKLVVAHNESFDRRRLRFGYHLMERQLPPWLSEKYIDTRRIAKFIQGDDLCGNLGLDNISKNLEIHMADEEDRHEALPDAILTSECLEYLLEVYQKPGPKTIRELITDIGMKYERPKSVL